MHKRIFYPAVAWVLGLSGALLRAAEITRAYEPLTGLWLRDEPITRFLLIFSAAAVLAFAAFAYWGGDRGTKEVPLIPGEPSTFSKVGLVASALILVGSVAFEFFSVGILPGSALIHMLLALFAAVSIVIALKYPGTSYNFFALVPVFWACFRLILVYRDRAANPGLMSYFYELMGVVAAVIFYFRVSGFRFGEYRLRWTIFMGFCSIYLSMTAAFGEVLAAVLKGVVLAHPESIGYMLSFAVFATAWLERLLSPKSAPNSVDTNSEEGL